MPNPIKKKDIVLKNYLMVFKVNNQTNKITGFSFAYICLFLLQFAVMVIEFSQIFIIGIVIEGLAKLNKGYSFEEFIKIALFGVFLGLVQIFAGQFLSYKEEMLIENTKQKLLKTGISKVLGYNLGWQETLIAGNKNMMLQDGSKALPELLIMVPQIFILGLSVFITLVYLSVVNILLLPLGLIAIITSLGIGFFIQPKIKNLRSTVQKIYENQGGKIYEAFNNIHILKSSGATGNILSPVYQLFGETLTLEKKMIRLMTGRTFTLGAIIQIIGGIYILYGGYLILIGSVSFGVMYAGFRYLMKLSQEVNRFTRLSINIGTKEAQGARFFDIYHLQVNDNFRGVVNLENQTITNITIQNLNFNYSTSSDQGNQLRGINMQIPNGQKVGLVGTTGSGKSTLAKILAGLYPINSGSIQISTTSQVVDFYDQTLDSWHSRQFLVSQDPELFNATLRENITLFDPKLNQHLLDQSITVSQLGGVIDGLPKGMDTLIGEKGYKLSGGQRQRIGIARAIYKNTDIICFDESTSALDSKTEQDFQNSLEQIWDKKTLIFIAHRLSSLKNVDIIYVFENGRIIEQGSFKELVHKKGKFNQLWQFQQKDISD